RHQCPGVEERGLVRVVLEGGEVQPDVLGQPGERDDVIGALVLRGDEGAEGEVVAVVRHSRDPWISYLYRQVYRQPHTGHVRERGCAPFRSLRQAAQTRVSDTGVVLHGLGYPLVACLYEQE